MTEEAAKAIREKLESRLREQLESRLTERAMSGAELIEQERARQIEQCGWTAEKDDAHDSSELLECAIQVADDVWAGKDDFRMPMKEASWPYQRAGHVCQKYGTDHIRRLAIAGALIAAEIDRLERENKKGKPLIDIL